MYWEETVVPISTAVWRQLKAVVQNGRHEECEHLELR